MAISRQRARTRRERGFVALTTVIIIGAIILIIGVSAEFMAQTEIIISGQADRGEVALSLASSCANEALLRLKLDPSYIGGTVPLGSGTCTAAVSGTGSSRTITAVGTSGDHTKTVQISASLYQNLAGTADAWHVDSWSVADP